MENVPEQPQVEVEQKWEMSKTLRYDRIPLGQAWDKKLGLRVRIIQLLSNALRLDTLVFIQHNPFAEARKEGYTEMETALRFTQPLDYSEVLI